MRRMVSALQSAAKSALRPGRMLVPIAAATMLVTSGLQAATSITSNFNVNINLTAACTVTPAGDINISYLSFGPAVSGAAAQTTVAIKCANTLPYTVALDTGSGGFAATPLVYTYGDTAVGLAYTLVLSGTGLTASGGNIGNGSAQNVTVQATLAGGLSGTCSASPPAACNNGSNTARQRTMTVTY